MAKYTYNILKILLCSSVFSFFHPACKSQQREENRIVSLVPSITEIIFAIGAQDNLKGVTIFCDYPSEAKKKEKVGDFLNPSIEKIVSLNPTIIFAISPTQTLVAQKLKAMKLNVYLFEDPTSIEEIFQQIDSIGALVGRRHSADSLIQKLKGELEKIKKDLGYKIYFEISEKPFVTIGNSSYLSDIAKILGCKNVFDDIDQSYPVVNQEKIIEKNPDVIVILHKDTKKEDVKRRYGWNAVSALKNDKIIDNLPLSLLLRPGPRIVEGVKELVERLK